MSDLPTITCLMPTCGRTVCIGESIYSFINQTYPEANRKLIILDTHPQDLHLDIFLPTNITYLKRDSHSYKNLGDKYRELVGMVDSELFCIWEDDDLWLPTHLESMAQTYNSADHSESNKPRKFGNKYHYTIMGGVGKPITHVKIEGNYCWCRYLYEKKNFEVSAVPEPFDIHFLALFDTVWQSGNPTYIYRWDNGQCHMSGLYGSRSYDDLYRMFEDNLSQIDISNILVEIKWCHDYTTLVGGCTL